MTSNIGYNLDESVVANMPRLLTHLERMGGAEACLTFGVGSAMELRGVGVKWPIVRHFPDGNGPRRNMTPDQVMSNFEPVRAAGFFGEYNNEDGLCTPQLVKLLPLALARGFRFTLPGIAVANLNAGDLDSYNQILDWMTDHPDQLAFSFHNYYAGRPDVGQDGIQSAYAEPVWSPDLPLPSPPRWTLGCEYELIKAHQMARGKPMPRMVCTEFGLGNVTAPNFGSIPRKQYGTVNGKPVYYDVNYGWFADANYFMQMWPQWSPLRTYAKQVIWADRMFFKPNGIPLIVYCYGSDKNRPPGSETDWRPFDVEEPDDFRNEVEIYSMSSTTPIPWLDYRLTIAGNASVNLRATATTSAAILRVIQAGRYDVSYDPGFEATTSANGQTFIWKHIRFADGADGFIASNLSTVTLGVRPPADAIPPEALAAMQAAFGQAKDGRDACQQIMNDLLPFIPI